MADSAKREKIAAARKKLKQYQKSGKGSNRSRESTPKSGAKQQKTEESSVPLSPDNKPSEENKENRTADKTTVQKEKPERKTETSSGRQNSPEPQRDQAGTPGQAAGSTSSLKGSSDPEFRFSRKRELTAYSTMSHRPTASTESLQQISRQINGILAESPTFDETDEATNNSITELETRNRDLAALLAQTTQNNEQLSIQAEQLKQHALALQTALERERGDAADKLRNEISPLKEQLQVHIQTIGILVAEKTELQSQLAQSQKISEQRFNEIEELEGRLKASRQRVGDLERNLSSTSSSSQQFEKTSKDSAKEIDRLKLELYKLNKSHEELKQQHSESQEKLSSKVSESAGLQQSLEELQRRVEMAELYSQQLSSQNEQGRESLQILEQLQREKETLTSQVQQYTESLQRVSAERDQMSEQYQQYLEQVQHQNQQLTTQVSGLMEEREKYITMQYELEAAVLELQKKLEDIGNQKPSVDENAYAETVQEVHKLQTEYDELRQRHDAQIRDNAQLSRFLEEKEGRILDLETRLEEVGDQAGDKAQLLENIQSDKTALSRALTQNRDLKTQLAELQNGFVKMSNDNMELMTQLQTEQHDLKDVSAKLGQQEDELLQIREALSLKETELVQARENSVETNKVKLLHDQIQDRMRHYEAQAHLVETLQKELESAKDMVSALTAQNSELRSMLIKATETRILNPDSQVESAQREDVIDSLQATIRQLELERNQMMLSLGEHRELADHLGVKVSDLQEELVQKSGDTDQVTMKQYNQMKQAMEMIQDKYNRVMRDKADLSDKADQLEHIVLQLQGETDTIGEYISLYHHQRALLQQRELQKNDYISHLADDREELQKKLGELQALVMQLMGEKHMLSSYTEESQRPTSPNIQPHLSSSQHRLPNGHTNNDWPDYTSSDSDTTESEVETIVGGKDDITAPHRHGVSEHDSETPTPTSTVPTTESAPSVKHHQTATPPQPRPEEQTAHKILNLLTEIGHSALCDSGSFSEQQFHPCKYCKGRLQIL